LERDTGELCGHIVAGHPGRGVAYIIPSARVIEDIKMKLKCQLELVMEEQSNTKENITPTTGTERKKSQLLPSKRPAEEPLPPKMPQKSSLSSNAEPKTERRTKTTGSAKKSEQPDTSKSTSRVIGPEQHESSPDNDNYGPEINPTSDYRSRNLQEQRRRRAATQRTNEYFVPQDGIDREIITADICRYLGNDALVRPGTYEAS
jgi:hypothetical protein